MIARKNIEMGLQCYISSSGVEDVVTRDKKVPLTQDFAFVHKFQRFREGWKLSFIGRGGEYGF
jgi:phage terminase large subunit